MRSASLFPLAFVAACAATPKPSTDASPVPPATIETTTAPPFIAASSSSSSAPVAAAPSSSSSAPVPDAPKKHGPFNVLLVSIDSLRADMPWNGYDRDVAPHLTALEKQSISYTHAYSISSFTSKSLGGFLGDKYPSEMKRTGSFFTRYLDDNPMFAEALHAQGIHTVAGHAHMYMATSESGFGQGFDVWKIVPGITFDYNTDPYITSQKLTPLAIEELSDAKVTGDPDHRFFAWFHYMDPHEKYQPHEESPKFGDPKKTKARDLYDQEVFYTDLWIGKLFDWVNAQPWAKDTVIVVTADHGEAFGEHKLYRHAFELYDVLVHVPMFFVVPGQKPRHIDAFRSHIDLVPTIFELLGAKPTAEMRGQSFAAELFGGEAKSRDVVCDLPEDSHNERRRAVIHDNWKIIALANDFRFELYDLANDPGELHDLIKKEPERAKQMIDLYKQISAGIKEEPVKGGIQKHKDR